MAEKATQEQHKPGFSEASNTRQHGRNGTPRFSTAEPEPVAADVGQEQTVVLDGIREEIEAVSAKADQLAEQEAQRDAERRAEMDQAGIDEPVVHGAPGRAVP